MRTAALVVCAAALAGCASTPAAPPEPEVVELRFGWKPGMKAKVEEKRERAGARQQAMTFRYAMEVKAVADGLALTTPELSVEGIDIPVMKDVIAASAKAHLVVNEAGTPLRIEGVGEVQKVLAGILEGMPLPPAAQQNLEASMSEEAIQAKEFDAWNQLVGFWNGGELELGASYELPPQPTATTGGAPFDMSMSYGAKARVPCTEKEKEPRCVRLEAVSTPEPKSLEAAIGATVGPMLDALGAQGVTTSGMSMRNTFAVIAEPATLLPHRFERERVVEMKLRLPNGSEQPFEWRESLVRTYAW